ncbi:unnamed protein product [Medioppia subpectinata]|uniref:Uncharacterized protein n=1 Tax=Medioppia subpectinata TaxID=1979941 RepID=A0A7R9Q806_9ACAR|nr:unnamed protein product [Medioppia subpectinata]CAG2115357.1 unnamed protein product [Medioppia subpectinata]
MATTLMTRINLMILFVIQLAHFSLSEMLTFNNTGLDGSVTIYQMDSDTYATVVITYLVVLIIAGCCVVCIVYFGVKLLENVTGKSRYIHLTGQPPLPLPPKPTSVTKTGSKPSSGTIRS